MNTVAVIFGGVSTEHLVSCRSAFYVINALKELKYDVLPLGITQAGDWLPLLLEPEVLLTEGWEQAAYKAWHKKHARGLKIKEVFNPQRFFTYFFGKNPEVIFPAVHGINCEDGTLQGFLNMTDIPYVGSGVLASALGMNKIFAKQIWAANKLPVVPYYVVTRDDLAKDSMGLPETSAAVEKVLTYPIFLKPASGGSSVGTFKAGNRSELVAALGEVSKFDREILLEQYIPARELEVAVLGNLQPQAPMVGEILMQADVAFYDYETKYFAAGASSLALPADLPTDLAERILNLAQKAYKVLGCKGMARVDFFLDRCSGALYLNEINSLPGFTATSLYPQAWAKAGINLPALVDQLCRLAIAEHQAGRRVETI